MYPNAGPLPCVCATPAGPCTETARGDVVDKLLHFCLFFGLAYGLLELLRRYSLASHPGSRFWFPTRPGAGQTLLVVLGTGAVGAASLGVAKELLDRLELVNYETADMVADLLGMTLAAHLFTRRRLPKVRRERGRAYLVQLFAEKNDVVWETIRPARLYLRPAARAVRIRRRTNADSYAASFGERHVP